MAELVWMLLLTLGGTPERDTVCESCTIGQFSSVYSEREQCKNCSECPAGTVPVKGSCNATSDTRCIQNMTLLEDWSPLHFLAANLDKTELNDCINISCPEDQMKIQCSCKTTSTSTTTPPGNVSSSSFNSAAHGIIAVLVIAVIALIIIIILLYKHSEKRNIRKDRGPWVLPTKKKTKDNVPLLSNLHQCGGFINTIGNPETSEKVNHTKARTTASDSVGYLVFTRGTATCFRVGTNKVMTACHVVPLQTGSTLQEIFNGAYVNFKYLEDGHSNEVDRFYIKQISSESDISYFDNELDCLVLELENNRSGQPMPPPFRKFDAATSRFHLIGHSQSEVKTFDKVNEVLDPRQYDTNKMITTALERCENKLRQIGMNPDDYPYHDGCNSLFNLNRYLFHCRMSNGASGSPGIIIVNGEAVVVTMLLRGYPGWYYENSEMRAKWEESFCIEQGANMMSVATAIKDKNQELFQEIFGDLEIGDGDV